MKRVYAKSDWQDGSYNSWTNIPVANIVDKKASRCIVSKGKKPKDVYFSIPCDVGKNNKVTNASICISLPIIDTASLGRPIIYLYDGSEYGKKAPYKTEPIKIINKPTKIGTSKVENKDESVVPFEGGSKLRWYHNYYNIKGITGSQLKHLYVKVVFPKANYNTTVTIGWIRVEALYEKEDYNLSIYSPDTNTTNIVKAGDIFKHTIIITNKSSNGRFAYYKVISPTNTKFMSCSNCGELVTSGVYKGYYKKWIPANSKVALYHNYKIKTIGTFKFKDTMYAVLNNGTNTQSYNWVVNSIDPEPPVEGESITIISPILYINTDGQYIDVIINGTYDGDGYLTYNWNANSDCTGNSSNHLLNMSSSDVIVVNDSINVTNDDILIDLNEQTIKINPNPNGEFSAHLRVPVNPTDYNVYEYDQIDGYYYEGVFYKHYLYDEIINGYLHNGVFYSDSSYTTIIPFEDNKFYRDLVSSKIYRYYNDELDEIITLTDWIFYDQIDPVDGGIYVDVISGGIFKFYDDVPLKVCRKGKASAQIYVDIYGVRYTLFNLDTDNLGFEQNYQLIMHTNLDGVSVINCESNNFCFFEPFDSDYEVILEKPSAYIGCVGLERAHQADNTAETKNGLISNNYLNRTYKGKTGNISEKIGMELFLSPAKVATLQGLVGIDKPIPLNLVPQMLDGDPLNHRGWAELYEVNNISKINDHLYKCEPEVDYLTHDLNTSFKIEKGINVANYDIQYYLSQTHNFNDKLSAIMTPSLLKNTYSDMVDNDGYVGHYILNKNNELMFITNNPISKFSDLSVKWRNILPILRSGDYDNNLNIKFQLIKKNVDEEPTVYVEHIYDGFKHYDNTNDIPLNRFSKVITRYLEDGIYKEVVHSDYSLLMNSLTPLAYDNKIVTKMWANSSTSIGINDDYFDIILATDGNVLIGGEIVTVTIESDYGYYDRKNYMTDMYGRIRISTNLENGDYDITVSLNETNDYRPCDFKTNINVHKGLKVVSINYLNDYETVNSNDEIVIQLLTEGGEILSNKSLIVDIRDIKSNHYGACINYITDNDGKINVPIIATGGSKIIRCRYLGNNVYNSASLEQEVFVNNNYEVNTNIESDDIVYNIGQTNKEFSIKLTYKDNPLSGETVDFIIYNNTEYIKRSVVTDVNGVASIPIYLTTGNWYIDTYYAGKNVINDGKDIYYAPALNTNVITSLINGKKDTHMTYDNIIINSNDDEPYKIVLYDANDMVLDNKLIKFIAYDEINNVTLFNGNIITNDKGEALLPFYDVKTNIRVEAIFDGDTNYNPCSITNYVSFYGDYYDNECYFTDNVDDIYLYNINGFPMGNEPITINVTSTTKNDIYNCYTYDTVTDGDGLVNYPAVNDGDYHLNIIHHNDNYKASNYYDTVHIDIGGNKTVNVTDDYLHNNDDYIIDFENISYSGKLFKCKVKLLDNITNEPINGAYLKCLDLEDNFISDGYSDDKGNVEFYILNPNTGDFSVKLKVTVGMFYEETTKIINFKSNMNTLLNKSYLSFEYIEPESFNPSSLNYQEISINVNDNNVTDNNNIGNNFIIRCTNLDNNEWFEIRGMCVNKLSNSLLNYYLNNGNWNISFYGLCNDGYSDCLNNETILVDSDNEDNPISELITIDGIDIKDTIMNGTDEDVTMFGSLFTMQLRDDKVSVYDYGYTNNDNTTDVKIKVEDIVIPKNDYDFRIIINYGNSSNITLNECEGLLQVELIEDVDISKNNTYNNLIVSPIPLRNNVCKFTRLTDEGRLYYYNYDGIKDTEYIGSPFNFYKGGTNLKNELGADIFDLSTASSPIYVTNGLCRIGIHRLSGYIELFVYDGKNNDWYLVNVLKIDDNKYSMTLNDYDDDKITVTFSDVVFTMWRGKPYVEIQHNNKDIRMLNYKDRVYCELKDNDFEMKLIEESEVGRGIFNVNTSVQKFNKELGVGENINLNNFDLFEYD